MKAELREKKDEQKVVPFKLQTGMEVINTSPVAYPSLLKDMLLEGVSMLCTKPKIPKLCTGHTGTRIESR
jgi:hypothetical protein